MSTERRKLVLGASWTLASTIVALIVGAILNPFLVFYLGVDGYGIWASAIAFASLFGLGGDLGVAGALTKFIAERRGKGQQSGSLVSSALTFGIAAGCAGGAALAGLSLFMDNYAGYDRFPLLLQLQALQMPLNLATSSLFSVLQGRRQFRTLAIFTIGQSISNLVMSLLFLAFGLGIPGVMVAAMITSAGMFLLLLFSSKADLSYRGLPSFREDFRRLVPFGVNLTATNAFSTLLYSVDIVVLSMLVRTPAIVGAYALAIFITRGLWILPTSISTTTYPVISEYSAAKDNKRVAKYLSTALSASAAATGILASALVLFGRPLIKVVFGLNALPAYDLALVLLPGTAIVGSLRAIAPSLAGVGRPDVGLRISALGAASLTFLTFLLTSVAGAVGAAVSVSIVFALVAMVLLWAMDHYVLHPGPGLLASRKVTATFGFTVAIVVISNALSLPAELDATRLFIAGTFWGLSVLVLAYSSGGRSTWGTFFKRSGSPASERS